MISEKAIKHTSIKRVEVNGKLTGHLGKGKNKNDVIVDDVFRKYEISACVIYQSITQLKGMYDFK